MIELQNLLLEQFRFAQNPTSTQFDIVTQAMCAYQGARRAVQVNDPAVEKKVKEVYLYGHPDRYSMIDAIKQCRTLTGMGLKESKD